MPCAPRAVRSCVVLFLLLLTALPIFGARKQNAGSSGNGATTAVPNCPNQDNTPNFAVLDGSALSCNADVPLGNRVVTLTDPANTFSVTITPAIWMNGFGNGGFQTNTVLKTTFTNLNSSKTLTLEYLVIGAALNNAEYVVCDAFPTTAGEPNFILHDATGHQFCTQPPLIVPGLNRGNDHEAIQPYPVTGADFANTRWDFYNDTAALGDSGKLLALTIDCIPQEFAIDYTPFGGSSPCVNNLFLPGGSGTPTSFLAAATDGTNQFYAGTLTLKTAPPATNDLIANATPITTDVFSDFINTSQALPQEVLSGTGAGNETVNQQDPFPPCSNNYFGGAPDRVFRSVWYTFTPTDNRIVNISTDGSRYNAVLSVYTSPGNGLVNVACDYDTSLGQSSSNVSFTPVSGTKYYLMVSEGPPDVGVVGKNGGLSPVAVPLANDATLVLNFNRGNPVPYIDSVQPVTAPPAVLPELIISGAGFADGAQVNIVQGDSFNQDFFTPTSTAPNQVIVNLLDLPGDFFPPTTLAVTVTNPITTKETSNVVFLPVTTQNQSFTLTENDFTSNTGGGFPLLTDLNNDAILDLVIPTNGESVIVFLGNGDGTFQPGMPATTGNGAIAAAVGDFNGDGNIDLVTANQIDGTVSLLLGNGEGNFGAPFSINTGNVPYSVAVGDFNRDGLLDVAVVNSRDNNVAILLGDGTGKLRLLQKYSTGASSAPTSVITGDFNGDGILDLVTANSGSSKVAVLLGNGDGTFQAAVPYATGSGPFLAIAADFNGDGKLDIATSNEFGGGVSVLLGKGDGTFAPHQDYSVAAVTESLVAGDFDGDGKLDIATVANTSQDVFILFGNGNGTFQSAVPFGLMATSLGGLTSGDLNLDGMLDLVTPTITGYSVLLQGTDAAKSGCSAGKTHSNKSNLHPSQVRHGQQAPCTP